MACRPGGALIFVIETSGGRLTLRVDAPDRVFVTKGGALVQMDWTCGPLRVPAAVWYVPARGSPGGVDGTALSFDLDSAR